MKISRRTMGVGVAFVSVLLMAGCTSMALKSNDAAKRMKAVAEVKDQSDLLEIALDRDYQNDVRIAALKKLTNQRNFWRVWCANGDNRELADKALELLTDESLLVRVALLHSYEESAEEKEARESSEKTKGLAIGAAALAVNAGGAVAGSKAKGAGGAMAAQAGTGAANVGLALAVSEQKEPEPNMAIRTNEAIVAVGKLKAVPSISTVALSSTIESVQLNALRKLLYATKDVQTLKDVAREGCLRAAKVTGYRNLDGDGKDISLQNKIIAIRLIQDSAALTNVIDLGYGESRKYAFARLIQMKDFDVAAEMLCKYNIDTFLSVEDDRDISDASGTKLVARFPEIRQCEALALRAKSDSVGKAAVERIDDAKILSQIINHAWSMAAFKAAANKVSDQHVLGEVIMAGGERSDYAISVLKDDAYARELYNKADKLGVRISLAKKIAQGDITADLCEKETAKEVKAVLLERASDEVKAELVHRRQEKIKKAIAVAEKDGKELLALIATKKSDQIDVKKIASIFKGRLLFFPNENMSANDYDLYDVGKRNACLITARKPTSDKWKVNTSIDIRVIFEEGAPSVKAKYSRNDRVSVCGIVNGRANEINFSIDGDVAAAADGLNIEKITHVFDLYDPDDVVLDSMLEDSGKSPTARYAESVGWELPAVSQSVMGSIKDAVQTVGEVKQAVDEYKATKAKLGEAVDAVKKPVSEAMDTAKEQVGEAVDTVKKEASAAWGGVKNMIKDGMKDALEKGKPDPKKASGGETDLDALLNDIDK